MKVGDIKIEALRLMFAELDPLVSASNLTSYENSDTIGEYLAGMTGSINRALADIESRRILPERSVCLADITSVQGRHGKRYDLSAPAINFYDVSRIILESDEGYDGCAPYRMEGKKLVLLFPHDSADVTLLYYPKIPPIATYDNNKELELPNEIAGVIPYFIKGELYRLDEIGDAAEAMSWYEQRIAALSPNSTDIQTHVVPTYSQVTL